MTTDYYTVFWARWNNFSTIGFYLNAKKFQTLPHVTKWRHNFVKWRLIGISCRCSILEIWGIIYAKSHLNPSGAHFRMPCYVSFWNWPCPTIRIQKLNRNSCLEPHKTYIYVNSSTNIHVYYKKYAPIMSFYCKFLAVLW